LVQRLLVLDDLWTAQLDAAAAGIGGSGVDDVDTLRALVAEMQDCLATIVNSAYEVRLMVSELSDGQMAEALDVIGQSPAAPDGLRERLEASLPDYEPRGAIITACEFVGENASGEADILSGKLAELEEGGLAEGDLGKAFKCAALLMLAGASVAGTIGLGGAPVFVGLSVAGTCGMGVVGWIEANCPKFLPAISGGRR
jgi:hypothetical protein